MWTLLHPFMGRAYTSDHIQREARLGIWRAVHQDRLIVMAGSGVTIPYGQPTWNEILSKFISITLEKFEKPKASEFENKPQLAPLLKQIRQIASIDAEVGTPRAKTDTLFVAVDLCEALLEQAASLSGRDKIVEEVRSEFSKIFNVKPRAPTNGETAETILNTLGVRRILTTNYDTVFENVLRENTRGDNASDPLSRLLSSDCEPYKLDRRLVSLHGLDKGIVSASLDQSNVGDLVNFAAYSDGFDAQVFHLHARLDRPAEMVVTRNDYRRVYVQEPRSGEAFHAAQEILFGGSDVVMMGFGANEEDLMRPFRRFVSRGRDDPLLPRRTFALFGSRYGEDWERHNAERAVRLAHNFDIFSIAYGGPNYRKIMHGLHEIRNKLDKKNSDESAIKALTDEAELGHATILLEQSEKNEILEIKKCMDARPDEEERERLSRLQGNLSSKVQARALCQELAKLKLQSRDWWDRRRQSPHERRARYHAAEKEIAEQPRYLSVRHCLDLVEPPAKNVLPGEWELLRQIRDQAPFVVLKHAPSRRILRLTGERGSGKATLVTLLHRKSYQEFIFSKAPGGQPDYKAAFIAHLSFSMEFTSVIKALTRFFALELAKHLREKTEKDYSTKQKLIDRWRDLERRPEDQRDLHACFVSLVARQARRVEACIEEGKEAEFLSLHRDLSRLLHLVKRDELVEKIKNWDTASAFRDNSPGPMECYEIGLAIAVLHWEDDQTNCRHFHSGTKPMRSDVPRQHRLDGLRQMMNDYGEAAPGRRLFVCLSGLDRITDAKGDAFNPAHRAFFRLVSGTEAKDTANPDILTAIPDPAIDLVLVADRPDVPICYLSDELELRPEDVLPGDVQNYARVSGTGRWLKKWFSLDHMDWRSRAKVLNSTWHEDGFRACLERAKDRELNYRTRPFSEDDAPLLDEMDALATFVNWAESTDSSAAERERREIHGSRRAHRLLLQNTAISLWVMRAWMRQKTEAKGDKTKVPMRLGFHSFLRDLDEAASGDGVAGVLQLVLDGYRKVDRETRRDWRLHDLILRHLALFALPIEPWVLIGCPQIQEHLQAKYACQVDDEEAQYSLEIINQSYRDWHQRHWMMTELKQALDLLSARVLVMRIHPPSTVNTGRSPSEPEAFLHKRFSLHSRMRQHLARSMRLSVHDGADLNHHRMSIYCDQPRDLPSPSPDHFDLVRGIVENLSTRCQDLLTAILDHTREIEAAGLALRGWDPEEDETVLAMFGTSGELSEKLATRIFAPKADDIDAKVKKALDKVSKGWEDPNGLAGAMGMLHALPQRLRALLSLIQGAFSIGSLSRLERMKSSHDTSAPFDSYRHWLDFLLTAGTTLERSRFELADSFNERILAGETADGGLTEWLLDAEKSGLHGAHSDPDSLDDTKLGIKNEYRIREAAKNVHFNPRQRTGARALRHPYYRDEIAWLYNESGLAALSQGMVIDAIAQFETASFIMSHRRTPDRDGHAFHAAERRVALNHSIALIERGEVGEARRLLGTLDLSSETIDRSTPSETSAFVQMYLGLCDHLSGGHQRAIKRYENVIENFIEMRKLRAVAMGNRLLADLLRTRGRLDDALTQARIAVNAAARAEQRDIQHLALVTLARIEIEKGDLTSAQSRVFRAIDYSQAMGLTSVYVDARIAHARIMLARGDFSLSGQYASEATALAVRNGLRLRKLSGLVTFAETRIGRGSIPFAKRVLAEVVKEAEVVGYLTLAASATELITQRDLEV